jgi:hypothetical protein
MAKVLSGGAHRAPQQLPRPPASRRPAHQTKPFVHFPMVLMQSFVPASVRLLVRARLKHSGAAGEPRGHLPSEDEFCAGDQEDDRQEALDHGVREPAAAEIGTRRAPSHDRHRQCERERWQPPGAGEIAEQAGP